FGISKSTVHKDVTISLEKVNRVLHEQIGELLDTNKRERHIRGGEATRKKYAAMKHQNAQ
ncbi:MAG: sporulation transcriptional regulator SpoIIID, partial [Clostridiales bacterium]|nr:sporulation transcriptional regulator SpoIIID [Clostridiales bacterium]